MKEKTIVTGQPIEKKGEKKTKLNTIHDLTHSNIPLTIYIFECTEI